MACVGRRPGRRRPRIFVSIAAYRDPECAWTLHSLFAAAAHPERVRVGVVWQVRLGRAGWGLGQADVCGIVIV